MDIVNPGENRLPEGMTEADLRDAVVRSGFPLQSRLANALRTSTENFFVQDEYGYIDADLGAPTIRTIDLLVDLDLHPGSHGPEVHPELAMLIECKRSTLPFVFFAADEKLWIPNFPIIAGLPYPFFDLRTPEGHTPVRPAQALRIDQHPFAGHVPANAYSFSRAARSSKLELTGADAYQSVTLPLLKAADYFVTCERPNRPPYTLTIVLPVAVLDAPMLVFQSTNDEERLFACPWVRVARHSPAAPNVLHRSQLYAIDVVHYAFFDTYLYRHVLPFARHAADLTLQHQAELLAGRGAIDVPIDRGHIAAHAKLRPVP
ncbi:MAG: hypothetical protein WEB52_13700 [Dehalococcoidia bacterium]